MFNNVFNKKDPVADMIAQIAEADYKAKMEELKGQQHKIDKNKNNKIDAHDFAILRGEKKGMKKEEAENVEETNNPFDWRNTKSRLPTKPGDKAGFDSKKISTGTVYTRRPVKDEPMKKEDVEQTVAEGSGPKEKQKTPYRDINSAEYRAAAEKQKQQMAKDKLAEPGKKLLAKKGVAEEIDPNDTTTDTLKGREKTSGNPFLSKKVKMDVPDNVKEEAEQIDELSKDTLKSYSAKAKASAKSHKDAADQYDSDPDERAFAPKQYKKAASRTAGAAKADRRIKEEAEQIDELKKATVKSYLAKKMASLPGKDPKKDQKDMMKAHHRVTGVKPTSEEAELDEANIQPTGAKSRTHIGNLKSTSNSVVHPSSGKEIGIITKQPNGEYHAHHSAAKLSHSESGTFDSKDKAHQFIRNAHAKAIKNNTLSDTFLKKKPLPQFAKEEAEQLDELSPGLLDRAANIAAKKGKEARAKGHDEAGDEHMGQAVRLRSGYHGAVERDRKKASMASMSPAKQRKYAISQKKSMGEEVEQVDERSLTSGEKAEMEKNVKGMKKSLAGFKQRYGDKAKSVMYATATARAKKD